MSRENLNTNSKLRISQTLLRVVRSWTGNVDLWNIFIQNKKEVESKT